MHDIAFDKSMSREEAVRHPETSFTAQHACIVFFASLQDP